MTGRQFAWFRIIFGGYLTIHFAQLIPYASELFSYAGALPDPLSNPIYGILPNALAHWNTPQFATAFLMAMTVLSVLFAMGFARHVAAALLWYGWACLFNRNVLISNPLDPVRRVVAGSRAPGAGTRTASTGTPETECRFLCAGRVFWTAWGLMAAGYTFSGIANSRVRVGWMGRRCSTFCQVRSHAILLNGVHAQPAMLLAWTTWAVLLLEVLFVPLVDPSSNSAICVVEHGRAASRDRRVRRLR